MNLTIVIVLSVAITLALVIFPLIVSYKAEKLKKESDKSTIANYGNKINKKICKNCIKLFFTFLKNHFYFFLFLY